MTYIDLIGLVGMILVFLSFIVKRWLWLYLFNASGAAFLALYAYLEGNMIFLLVELGILFFLSYRLVQEAGSREAG